MSSLAGRSRSAFRHRRPLGIMAVVFPLLLFGTSGCYHYVESSPAAVELGAEVRVYARGDVQEVFRGMGENEDTFLDGRWMEFRDDAVVLSVSGDEFREGLQTRTLRRRIVLEPERLNRVEVRSLDRFRTGAVVTGLVVGAALFIMNTFQVNEPGTPRRPPQNGDL